jgi:DNA-binding transcriptional regulator YhcF (GntR family)
MARRSDPGGAVRGAAATRDRAPIERAGCPYIVRHRYPACRARYRNSSGLPFAAGIRTEDPASGAEPARLDARMNLISLSLDRSSPTPLYHQIVQAIRWRIGTGVLGAGDPLPPIREAAEHWGVNYHTVRRAYHELVLQGWVESAQGSGTQVAAALPFAVPDSDEDLNGWLDQVLTLARERYGLSAEDLAVLVQERGRVLRVVMVECNAHQSNLLARQLERAWEIEAIPWPRARAQRLAWPVLWCPAMLPMPSCAP